jgi:thioredoxin 1
MKQLLFIGAAIIILAIMSFAQTSTATAVSGTKNVTTTKAKAKVKKKTVAADSAKTKEVKLPKLVDLGAGKCIPCKMMAPILEGLKKDYAGKLDVVFIDVWQSPGEGQKYGIKLIPTQIFYDSDGKELYRHEGFFAKEDILSKWKELGYQLKQ